MPRTSAQVRAELVDALSLDLIGPGPGHALEGEVLQQPPSRWYLTGFLVPFEAPEEQRADPTANEEIAAGGEGGGADDDEAPEQSSARRAHFPSSIGLSVQLAPGARDLEVTVTWGDYRLATPAKASTPPPASEAPARESTRETFRREARAETVIIDPKRTRDTRVVPHSDGLKLVISTRALGARTAGLAPKGTRVVSIFLVNHRSPLPDQQKEEAFVFQAGLRVSCEEGFHPRPNIRGLDGGDWDERYRKKKEGGEGKGSALGLAYRTPPCTTGGPRLPPHALSPRPSPLPCRSLPAPLGQQWSRASASERRSSRRAAATSPSGVRFAHPTRRRWTSRPRPPRAEPSAAGADEDGRQAVRPRR